MDDSSQDFSKTWSTVGHCPKCGTLLHAQYEPRMLTTRANGFEPSDYDEPKRRLRIDNSDSD